MYATGNLYRNHDNAPVNMSSVVTSFLKVSGVILLLGPPLWRNTLPKATFGC